MKKLIVSLLVITVCVAITGSAYPPPANIPTIECEVLSVPEEVSTDFKAWMDYRTITNKTSVQWQLQQDAVTDENGFRKLDGKYMVAVGTYYAKQCGEQLVVLLENGTYFEAVVADIKQDKHTDKTNRYTPVTESSGNILEFIVDSEKLHKDAKILGDISAVELQGNVVSILKQIKSDKEKFDDKNQ